MSKLRIIPFKEPQFVTRPLLPDLEGLILKLTKIWDSKWLTNGGLQHKLLESNISKILKVPHVSLFNNGTVALLVGCRGLGLSGEVITTPFTFPATPHALAWNNITPVFCDIDPVTMNIDADKIESLITKKTTGILAVHVFGTPCDVKKIQRIADKHHLKVIYDAAHAFEVEVNGKGIGSFGDLSMFSFHATKLFHTAEGGALAIKDKEVKKKIELMKNFGIKNEEEVLEVGINGKMNELQAALGLVVLTARNEERKKRKALFATYKKYLKNIPGISFYENESGIKNSYQYFVVRINEDEFGKSRDYVYEQLKLFNIFSRKYFYPLCSEYPCYKDLPSSVPASLPVAQKVAAEVLSLPFHGGLLPKDVEKICTILDSIRNY